MVIDTECLIQEMVIKFEDRETATLDDVVQWILESEYSKCKHCAYCYSIPSSKLGKMFCSKKEWLIQTPENCACNDFLMSSLIRERMMKKKGCVCNGKD